ncbi:Zinc finger protein 431, partial [Lemmus lemmus]
GELGNHNIKSVTYDDVNFTQKEWDLLNPFQKNLYKDMMQETYRNLTSIGYIWEHHNCKEHCQCSIRHARIERNQNGDKLSVYIQCGEKHRESKQCGKAFAYYSQHQMHKRKHSGEKTYEYSQGHKDFVLYATHQSHKRTHTGEKPYECNQCGKALHINLIFECIKEHILERNPMNVINVVRPLYIKIVFNCIKEHILDRKKPYESNQSGKAFAQHSCLQRQNRLPSREKPHECNQYGLAFGGHCTLQGNNKRKHCGGDAYQCKKASSCIHTGEIAVNGICDESFVTVISKYIK